MMYATAVSVIAAVILLVITIKQRRKNAALNKTIGEQKASMDEVAEVMQLANVTRQGLQATLRIVQGELDELHVRIGEVLKFYDLPPGIYVLVQQFDAEGVRFFLLRSSTRYFVASSATIAPAPFYAICHVDMNQADEEAWFWTNKAKRGILGGGGAVALAVDLESAQNALDEFNQH